MTKTFLKGAIHGFLFGPLMVILHWVFYSALLSLIVLLVSIILTWDGVSPIDLNQLVNWDTGTLTSLPYFIYLDYVQIMWAGLLVPVVIAGGLYVIVLAQGTGDEKKLVDFFNDVARGALLLNFIVIAAWLLGGVFWAFYHDSTIMHSTANPVGEFWLYFEQKAIEGLQALGLGGFMDTLASIMTVIYPYIPMPFLAVTYIYMFGNIHAGWMGNAWKEVSA